MFPVIDLKGTGINLRRIVDKQGISAKDVQEYLNLASVQSVYNWCNGINMPTIDNLYALSQLFQLPMIYRFFQYQQQRKEYFLP